MTSKSRKPDVADGSPADETTRELEQIENRFLTALARGEAPSVAEIVAAHPDLASQLRQRLDDARALHELHHMQSSDARNGEPAETRLPERIDRYVILGKLGEGAASVVLRAFDPVLDRPVAIKLLRLELPAGSDFNARFEREARVVAGLRHAHIVPVFDCGEFAGRPYLVMELVAGQTLDDELALREPRAGGSETLPPLDPPVNGGKEAPSPFAGRAGVGLA